MYTHASITQAKSQRSETREPARHQAAPASTTAPQALDSGIPHFSLSGLSLRSGAIQPSLAISHSQDQSEIEAERVADEVVNMPAPTSRTGTNTMGEEPEELEDELEIGRQQNLRTSTQLNRACAECEEEATSLQRSPDARLIAVDRNEHPVETGVVAPETEAEIHALRGGGTRLSESTRQFMEPRFKRDFGGVRIHTGDRAASLANSLQARAFTVGNDVVFGAGEYRPTSLEGKHLIAHELTHVVQQGQTPRLGENAQKPESLSTAPTRDAKRRQSDALHRSIVADSTLRLSPGQMTKSVFMAALKNHVTTAVSEGLEGSGRSAEDCPYVSRWISHYEGKDAAHVERAARRYTRTIAPPGANAQDYLRAISSKVRTAATRWAQTGETTALPNGTPEAAVKQWSEFSRHGKTARQAASRLHERMGVEATAVGNKRVRVEMPVSRRPQTRAEGGETARTSANNGAASETDFVKRQLGEGLPLTGTTRKRMEGALGESFSAVRVHNDAKANRLARAHGAQAFTLGRDIVFDSGKYQPGTPKGDALLAHELSHVAQQRGALASDSWTSQDMGKGGPSDISLEQDADVTAREAMLSLWGGKARRSLRRSAETTRTRLRSGLRLSRCSSKKCDVKSGPTYTPAGPINASTSGSRKTMPAFTMAAEFNHDPANGIVASCCQVRQMIKWDAAFAAQWGGPPHSGFPSGHPADTYIEDTDGTVYYGHRDQAGWGTCAGSGATNRYQTGATIDQATGTQYCGWDEPAGPATNVGKYSFQLKIIDTCNSNAEKASSSELVANW